MDQQTPSNVSVVNHQDWKLVGSIGFPNLSIPEGHPVTAYDSATVRDDEPIRVRPDDPIDRFRDYAGHCHERSKGYGLSESIVLRQPVWKPELDAQNPASTEEDFRPIEQPLYLVDMDLVVGAIPAAHQFDNYAAIA